MHRTDEASRVFITCESRDPAEPSKCHAGSSLLQKQGEICYPLNEKVLVIGDKQAKVLPHYGSRRKKKRVREDSSDYEQVPGKDGPTVGQTLQTSTDQQLATVSYELQVSAGINGKRKGRHHKASTVRPVSPVSSPFHISAGNASGFLNGPIITISQQVANNGKYSSNKQFNGNIEVRQAASDVSSVTNNDELAAATSRNISRRVRCANCCKNFIAFLFSTIGLTCLLVGYVVVGGIVFMKLEASHELQTTVDIKKLRLQHVQRLWRLTETLNVFHPKNWTAMADRIFESYTDIVYTYAKKKGWDGNYDNSEQQWSFAGALLYSITVITTIGYGHITPKTNWGRITTIIYAIFGIPLTLLTITNLGGFMATAFRFLYKNICCGLCCLCCWIQSKRKRHRRVAKQQLKDTENDNESVWRSRLHKILSTDDLHTVTVPIYVSLLLITAYIALGALLFTLWETDWNYLIGCYFCFITLSTIGFGDFVPGTSLNAWASQEKLVLCALYLLVGLALIAMCFDLMQEQARNHFQTLGRRLGLLDKKS